jgi:hypothetical protein
VLLGCAPDDGHDDSGISSAETAGETETAGGGGTSGDSSEGDGVGDSDGDGGTKFDVQSDGESASATDTGPGTLCKVVDDMDAIGDCEEKAPPDSFDPVTQWEWWGPDDQDESSVATLVANFTDDDENGEIDLCDIPDVVVVTTQSYYQPGRMFLLSGDDGHEHFEFAAPVSGSATPAIGDIDDDGLPEVVTTAPFAEGGGLIAFEHDGAVKWQAATPYTLTQFFAVALADLDNDGDAEIIVGNVVADHQGQTVFEASDYFWNEAHPSFLSATGAADLDGDGDLEVVMGRSAWHHDGTQYYNQGGVGPGYPQVANLDGDDDPEVLVNNQQGLTVLEHTGAVKYQNLRPTGDPQGFEWYRPATVHDFDGDGVSEYAVSSGNHYSGFEVDATIVWTADVKEPSCCAAGTAFDFLGDGVAEAMYADETTMHVFDGLTGMTVFSQPRSSWTNTEYPVVVDVDNDGSAEILVVSNGYNMTAPTVEVFADSEARWVQPRRIWNQHTYHVTNVREDATIPQFEKPSWELLNTYRTNAQIQGGGVCKPKPEG